MRAEELVRAGEEGDAAPAVDTAPDGGGAHEIGERVGRYVVVQRLGGGGAGDVVLAYDTKLGRRVALKFLRSGGRQHELRLEREAQAMAQLSHPNVVQVFDTGTADGRLYLAMEYVEGTTLRAWQRQGRPWRDVLNAYRKAGEGLAAAHAAGLVHRDFKPDNVLLSVDGRVKVTDFGIARALLHEEVEITPPEDSGSELTSGARRHAKTLDTPLTEVGAFLGTPGYMAPEQYCGELTDARTDQFAFCVSLYEALYGERPFGDPPAPAHEAGTPSTDELSASVYNLAESTVRGVVRDPPRGTRVPAHLRRALLRGLRSDAADRFPSMEELLVQLGRDPQKRALRWLGAVAGASAILGTALAAARITAARQARVCVGAEAEAAETWTDAARAQIERAMLATRAPYAADTWRRTREQIDGYMSRWVGARRRTCEMTMVQHTQPEAVMTARVACLEKRRAQVGALAAVLATANEDLVGKALPAAMELPPLEPCDDVLSLMSVDPEPTDPARKGEIEAIRAGLAAVEEQRLFSRYDEAQRQAAPLVERARRVGYTPVLAEALLASSRAKGVGAPLAECIADGNEAMLVADTARADATRGETAIWLAELARRTSHLEDSERWLGVAGAVLDRTGDTGPLRARLFAAFQGLRYEQGRDAESAVAARSALDVARRTEVSPLFLARLEVALAEELAALGKGAEADLLIAEAGSGLEQKFGADHPDRLFVLDATSYVASVEGDHRRALEATLAAIDLSNRVAPASERAPTGYCNACWELHSLGRDAEAMPYCQKAVELSLAISGPESGDAMYAYRDTGDVQLGLRRYDDAVVSYEKAAAIHEKVGQIATSNYVYAQRGIGKARLLSGHPREAVGPLRTALAMGVRSDLKSTEFLAEMGDVRFTLARALRATEGSAAEIRTLVGDAADSLRRANQEAQAREVEAWLAEADRKKR